MKKRILAVALCMAVTVGIPLQASATTHSALGADKLNNAIEFAANGDTIVLTGSINMLKETITIPSGKNLTIDLKGYYIYDIQYATTTGGVATSISKDMEDQPMLLVSSGATLTLQSTSGTSGKILNRADGGVGIVNNGTMILQSGEVSSSGENGEGIKNAGNLTVSGGTVSASGKDSTALVNSGTANMTGGTVDATPGDNNKGVLNTGKLSMTGGTVKANCRAGRGIYNQGGTVSFTGGNITASGSSVCGLYNESGTVSANTGVIYCSGAGSMKVYNTSEPTGTGTSPGAGTAAGSLSAVPTASAVYVNGAKVAFDSYLINGNNYFKLRDLAYTLNGTNKQFEVEWSQENQTISMTGGKAYTIVGGEMESKGTAAAKALPTSHQTYYNKVRQEYAAYNIGGNNYFKLRDIGQAMNFDVDWDAAANAISIDTYSTYSAD